MCKNLNRTIYKVLFVVYPILYIIAFFQTRGILPPQYCPTTGIVVWPLRILLIYIGLSALMKYKQKNNVVFVFLLYSLLTIFSYLLNGFPLELYLLCCVFFLSPVLYVYVGLDNNKECYYWFYKSFFWASAVCCAIGLLLFFIRPEWYETAVIAMTSDKHEGVYDDAKLLEWSRFSSYLSDSYEISYMTMTSVPIGLFLWSNEDNRSKARLYLIGILVLYFSSLLCQQRASMFSTTLFLVVFMYLRNRKNALKIISIALIISLIIGLIIVYAGDNEIVSLITTRVGQMNYSEAMSERANQHENILAAWNNYIFGEGIGSACGFAKQYNMIRIPDGAYLEVLYEIGIIGFILFMSILLKALFRALQYKRFFYVELAIIGSFMIAMTGACPFVYFFYMFPFWFAIGRIMNPNYLAFLKENKFKV